MALTITRGTNLVEHHESTPLTTVNDALEVHADSSEFTFAAIVTGGANFTLAFECNFNGGGTWFELDTSKTINANGQYAYFYSGNPQTKSVCVLRPSALAPPALCRSSLLHITAND